MSPSPQPEITRLLAAVGAGDSAARETLYALVYPDLRRIASAHLRGRGGATLSTTGMVNEAYLRLAGSGDWENRVHFLSVASRAMRQILVDHARRRLAAKRGGGQAHVTLDEERDLEELARNLNDIPGVIDHGLFLHEADEILVDREGEIERITR